MAGGFALAIAAVAVASSCDDDTFTSRGDLFQPNFIEGKEGTATVTNNNDVSMVWYKSNDAVSYTVQLFEDSYYQHLYLEKDVTDPYITILDLPYASRFYVRVRCNAADPIHNSQWATTDFTTEARPDFAQLLNGVSKSDIGDNEALITWIVDTDNPVDSFSVTPAMDATLPEITGYLSAEQIAAGEMRVTGLTASTLYNVNIYDTNKPRKHDKPYNQVTFRTTGPAPETFVIGLTDNLSDILLANNEDPEVPEGAVYELPAGSTYTLSTFAIKKGFKLVGPTDGDRPVVIINGTWSFQSGAYISSWGFENIELRNQATQQYFFNCGNPFTLENVSFTNCYFRNIYRGFWRHQASNSKHIMEFEIDNCWFDQCGWQGSTYGTFNFGSAGRNEIGTYDAIDNLTIRNTTFSRGGYKQDPTWGWGNLIAHSTSSTAINLIIENVTFYDFCVNNRLIDISNTERSTVNIRNVIVASPMGELIALGSGTRTSFDNNYTTTDYSLGGRQIRATDLSMSATDLFQNPEGGDYTIKDHGSLPYLTEAGDRRWLE